MVLFFVFFEGVKIYIVKHKFNKGNWNVGMIHCSVQERPRNISVHVLLCWQQGWLVLCNAPFRINKNRLRSKIVCDVK